MTHSSGNHGQALAWAASEAGLPCQVVIPRGAPAVKAQAIGEVLEESVLRPFGSFSCQIFLVDFGLYLAPFVNSLVATESYGATLVYCDPTPAARASTCAAISERENYEIIPPYDHYDVIAGQGTIALEFLSQVQMRFFCLIDGDEGFRFPVKSMP